jgi:ribosomal protein S27AE
MTDGPLDNMPRYCANCGTIQSDFDRESYECGHCGYSYNLLLPSQVHKEIAELQVTLAEERRRRKRAEARLATENRVNEKLKKNLFEAESELIQALAKLDMED